MLPDENEIAIHGILNARSKAVLRWSEDTATEIRDRDQYHFEQAHRHVARSNGLHEALDRAILLQDIRVSSTRIYFHRWLLIWPLSAIWHGDPDDDSREHPNLVPDV